ncbi:MAG TPA: hypothetical protein VFL47_01405 [Flavisolibacter sp.]|nr:hypothetical protein [Flavisolibacter sp.]
MTEHSFSCFHRQRTPWFFRVGQFFKKISGLQVVLPGSGTVFQKKKLTDTGFDLVFSKNWIFYKNLLDGGFSDLDGWYRYQSTSDTKVAWHQSLHKSKTARFCMLVFTSGARKLTMFTTAGVRCPAAENRHRSNVGKGAFGLIKVTKRRQLSTDIKVYLSSRTTLNL